MKVTHDNYYNVIAEIGVKNLPANLQEEHKFAKEATVNNTNWDYYYHDEDIYNALNKHFKKIEVFLTEQGSKPSKNKPAKKAAKKNKETSSKGKLVRKLKEEIKFVKRFVGLHNKIKTANAILIFIKDLQKSITQKLISKDSPFVKEIEYIQDQLILLYNKLQKKRDQKDLVLINDSRLGKLVGIAGGEDVYTSIGLMKIFIGMQGKIIDKAKKEYFLNRLERALKSEKIKNDDPFYDRLKKISSYLKGYKTGKVTIEASELNGLNCICNSCDQELGRIYEKKVRIKGKKVRKCKSKKYSDAKAGACSWNKGLALGKIYNAKGKKLRRCKSRKYSDAKAGACSYNKGLAGVMTAEEMVNLKFDLLPFSGTFANLFGKPEKNFSLMIHGEPGSGKSTFLIKFAKYLTGFGKVLYISSEEYGSVTLQNLIKAYMSPLPQNIMFTSDPNAVKFSDYDFVIFDSVNNLGMKLEDYKKLKAKNPGTAFITVLQHTKDGNYRGGKDWEHEAQIAAEIAAGTIMVYKNRYGVKGNWHFFERDFQVPGQENNSASDYYTRAA